MPKHSDYLEEFERKYLNPWYEEQKKSKDSKSLEKSTDPKAKTTKNDKSGTLWPDFRAKFGNKAFKSETSTTADIHSRYGGLVRETVQQERMAEKSLRFSERYGLKPRDFARKLNPNAAFKAKKRKEREKEVSGFIDDILKEEGSSSEDDRRDDWRTVYDTTLYDTMLSKRKK